MRQVAAGQREHVRIHSGITAVVVRADDIGIHRAGGGCRQAGVVVDGVLAGTHIEYSSPLPGTGSIAIDKVIMLRHLLRRESDVFDASLLANRIRTQARPLPLMNRHTALEIGQSKRADAIAAEGGANKGKQGRILRDGQ